ncbi:uncharacterized protein E0L32_006195 [Thyridium curvatum]|uniref:Uncharacterized protein n=1 Tax=Thyridium curvatum TaxID=1093900 RepID=A0A507ARM6_9PEZI|nr:uncharacterized protein E0L32_006195 [Thyridium curvatum]TPX13465.1 hypothetical protein E0L32_006195 [Thyridium curvatum]
MPTSALQTRLTHLWRALSPHSQLLRTALRQHQRQPPCRKPYSNSSNGGGKPQPSSSSSSSASSSTTTHTRAERILSRLPPSMQKYTRALRNAPLSHVVSFLILHEMTAVVPLLGLFGLFHYTDKVPVDYVTEHYGGYVREGARRFEKYFRRKGWFGFGADGGDGAGATIAASAAEEASEDAVRDRWMSGDTKYKVVVEIALAYAITKALLPVRIVASVWATPWFAGVLGGLQRLVRRR